MPAGERRLLARMERKQTSNQMNKIARILDRQIAFRLSKNIPLFMRYLYQVFHSFIHSFIFIYLSRVTHSVNI